MATDKETTKKRRVGDGTPGPGRRKGVPNKMTVELKEMIRQALDEAGGVAYLVQQAEDNPKAFLTLVGRLLPLDIKSNTTIDVTMKESRDAAAAAFYRSAADKARQSLQ